MNIKVMSEGKNSEMYQLRVDQWNELPWRVQGIEFMELKSALELQVKQIPVKCAIKYPGTEH